MEIHCEKFAECGINIHEIHMEMMSILL